MSTPDHPPKAAVPRRHGLWALLALAGLLASAGLWWAWNRYAAPALPEIDLAGADPEVAALVRRAAAAVRREPRAARAWGRLGMALLANKFEDESVAPLARAEALDPADARWPYLRGVALVGRDPDEALPCFRRAAARCGAGERRAAARLRLAETLAANGHNEEAEAEFHEVPPGPLAPCADYGLGTLAAVRGDLTAARDHLNRCAQSPLTRQKAAARLAALARLLGEAEAGGRAELPADPPWPDPFLAECLTLATGKASRLREVADLERQGQPDRALEVLRRVARDYPDASSWLALGITLGRRGYYQESETALRKCLELEPRLVRAQYYLSLALFGQGEALKQQPGRQSDSAARFEQAAEWARRATELDPGHGEAHFQLGLTLACLGRRTEALAAFRRAVATRPELPDAHLWLGKALAEDGAREEAVRHLRDAVRYAAADDPRPRQALEQVLGRPKP
jgi:tetratricopeptide (TPR) repeat protein